MEPLVAQGCRPLGEGLLSVHSARGNIVMAVADAAGRQCSPLDALREQLGRLPPETRCAGWARLGSGARAAPHARSARLTGCATPRPSGRSTRPQCPCGDPPPPRCLRPPARLRRRAAASSLVLGLAPDGFKPGEELGAADFLVRALVGADAESGALAVGEAVRVGQRLRFMVRDR